MKSARARQSEVIRRNGAVATEHAAGLVPGSGLDLTWTYGGLRRSIQDYSVAVTRQESLADPLKCSRSPSVS